MTLFAAIFALFAAVADVTVSPQSFDAGGWGLETSFTDVTGSPYLIAHGMGRPVPDATAEVEFPSAGEWHVFVRSKNWLPADSKHPADAKDYPGRFRLIVDGKELPKVFGCSEKKWAWEEGGTVTVPGGRVRLALRDLDGFDGRCAGLVFSKSAEPPTGAIDRRGDAVAERRKFDLVVVGGGVPGCCAAVAAARQGLKVALVQDRFVFGGNASSEIRVWSAGELRHPIVREMRSLFFNRSINNAHSDKMRLAALQREANLSLFPGHRVFAAEKRGSAIASAKALDIARDRVVAFDADYFVDATGDGWLGFYAGAEYRYGREARSEFGESFAPEKADRCTLGASLMWESAETNTDMPFSAPWAEPYACGVSAVNGEWNWEYGIDRDMIKEGEEIRDRLLLAIYGAFSLAKKEQKNARRMLTCLPYVLGKRESRRLMGDWIYKESDVTNRTEFADSIATGSWSVDLHYVIDPAKPFLTRCEQPHYGRYYIPYRSIYSKNVENLFMAGRCFSCTHVGLGGPRVINTLSQLGVAAGTAAAMCRKEGLKPRELWTKGRTRELQRIIGGDWPGNPDPARKNWRIVDDEDKDATSFGEGWGYALGNANGGQCGQGSTWVDVRGERRAKAGKAVYRLPVEKKGRYILRATSPYHPWRTDRPRVAIILNSGGKETQFFWEQIAGNGDWTVLGEFELDKGATLTVDPKQSGGHSVVTDGYSIEPVQ